MMNAILEITENEYCIKLNKKSFHVSHIKQLIAKIQTEEMFCTKAENSLEEDFISKNLCYDNENFDHLDEK